jgi:hypothetical protein
VLLAWPLSHVVQKALESLPSKADRNASATVPRFRAVAPASTPFVHRHERRVSDGPREPMSFLVRVVSPVTPAGLNSSFADVLARWGRNVPAVAAAFPANMLVAPMRWAQNIQAGKPFPGEINCLRTKCYTLVSHVALLLGNMIRGVGASTPIARNYNASSTGVPLFWR